MTVNHPVGGSSPSSGAVEGTTGYAKGVPSVGPLLHIEMCEACASVAGGTKARPSALPAFDQAGGFLGERLLQHRDGLRLNVGGDVAVKVQRG